MPEGTYLQRLTGAELDELQSRLSDPERPYLVGYGPADFSTSLALELYPSIIWDVNGYYRDLGVGVKANKRQLKEAYQRLEGWNSRRLTMILNILLNPKRRLLYDLAPFDSMYVDAEVDEFLRRQAVEAAAEKRRNGEEIDPDEMQKKYESVSQSAEEMQDEAIRQMQRDAYSELGSWSFYLWRTENRDIRQLSRLAEWRGLLAKHLNERWEGAPIRIGVGFFAGDEDAAVAVVGLRAVVFLNEKTDPTDVVACMAVVELLRHQQTKQNLNQLTGVRND